MNDYTLFVKGIEISETEDSIDELFNEIYKHRDASEHLKMLEDAEDDHDIVVKVNFIYNIKNLQTDVNELLNN